MPRESLQARKKRTAEIIELLSRRYGQPTTALSHHSPLELLVAVILSAQCTDQRVNIVTQSLFKKYRTPADYANAPPGELENDIRSTGFFNSKARAIRGSARMIIERFGGQVPRTMDELLELPGVARKTANVVLGAAYGINVGVVVDTHVIRLAGRLGLTAYKNNQGDRIEKDLMKIVPPEHWGHFSHLLIWHGRAVCTARKPNCADCPVSALCPSAFTFGQPRPA